MATSDAPRDLACGIYLRFSGDASDVTEDDISAAFAPFGALVEVFAKTERGFAFVTFNAAGAAAAAVAGGVTEIGGAAVAVEARVEKVRTPTPESQNIYLNDLTEDVSREAIEDALAAFGAVNRLQLNLERGFCYAEYESTEEAAAAVAAAPLVIDGVEVGVEFRRSRARKPRAPRGERAEGGGEPREPRAPKAKKAPSPASVYIKGMSEDYTEEQLGDWAASIGAVANVEWPDASTTGHAFVTFEAAEDAQAAIATATDGFSVELRTSAGRRRRRR